MSAVSAPLPTLSHNQHSLLTALADCRWHSYCNLVMATGLYSNLPAELRQRHAKSLGDKGLVRELSYQPPIVVKSKRSQVWVFQITRNGCAYLGGKPNYPFLNEETGKAAADFAERYLQYQTKQARLKRQAKEVGLRGNVLAVLEALADGSDKTFSAIARATGIFSGLPQYLRSRHDRHKSLASLGLAKETITINEDGRSVFAFRITAAGKKTLATARQVR